MKKILALMLVLSFAVGCSSLRKKGDAADDGSVKSETMANGQSEKLDGSPMLGAGVGSDSGSIDGLQSVFFEYDKATLSESESEKLKMNAAWMKKNSTAKLAIEGHCDQRGSNEYNLSLGERRANAVKRMLMNMGVSSKRLTTVSFGEEKPLVQGDSEEAMVKNRRANFVPSN